MAEALDQAQHEFWRPPVKASEVVVGHAQSQTEDSLIWPFTANGQYNCKFGYFFLKDLETKAEEGTQLDLDKQIWKSIWSLDVPNKYKNIL